MVINLWLGEISDSHVLQVVPSVDEMAAATRAMMRAHGLMHACVIGHSYGTAVASRLLQDYGLNVDSLVLIDPVRAGGESRRGEVGVAGERGVEVAGEGRGVGRGGKVRLGVAGRGVGVAGEGRGDGRGGKVRLGVAGRGVGVAGEGRGDGRGGKVRLGVAREGRWGWQGRRGEVGGGRGGEVEVAGEAR